MKKLSAGIAIAALVAGVGIGGAAAQGNSLAAKPDATEIISDAGKLMYDYDVENIVPILQELGLKWQGRTAPQGQKVIIAEAPSGMSFVLMPTACKNGVAAGCVGVSMTAVFGGDIDQRTVTSFNYRYPFTSAGIEEGGSAFINRYEISDYGMPRGNFVTSLSVFLVQAEMLQESLVTATTTVSQKSYLGDLSANGLNLQQVFADEGAAQLAGISASSHQASLETTAEFVRVLVEADRQTPGKIVNITVNNPANGDE
ncbi:YbjN domain-containing protein [Parvularcula flava]|uniref:YbjN domain-containing protein n=1 Tax=Aquisalinus luteolus TaxID=1566827 RepID=A0A8J3ESR8_9PROT|nr:hypothetical protein [Aquisalinus luteolus]NHK29409.1 YbjN domain-containing protein [Aquisalinus luteolus]GGI02035.1 hypothetical protein GCM10011355_34090 [Aquisalinus luteolus]